MRVPQPGAGMFDCARMLENPAEISPAVAAPAARMHVDACAVWA